MNILDENIPVSQRQLLKSWRIRVRQIGYDISRKGIKDETASFVRRFLRHSQFNTKTKRSGSVLRVSQTGLYVWRLHAEQDSFFPWE